jgi:hypothetical protein
MEEGSPMVERGGGTQRYILVSRLRLELIAMLLLLTGRVNLSIVHIIFPVL